LAVMSDSGIVLSLFYMFTDTPASRLSLQLYYEGLSRVE